MINFNKYLNRFVNYCKKNREQNAFKTKNYTVMDADNILNNINLSFANLVSLNAFFTTKSSALLSFK